MNEVLITRYIRWNPLFYKGERFKILIKVFLIVRLLCRNSGLVTKFHFLISKNQCFVWRFHFYEDAHKNTLESFSRFSSEPLLRGFSLKFLLFTSESYQNSIHNRLWILLWVQIRNLSGFSESSQIFHQRPLGILIRLFLELSLESSLEEESSPRDFIRILLKFSSELFQNSFFFFFSIGNREEQIWVNHH